ncbi:MAG: hypothetical protein L0Y39_12545 [Methylococcaceae bacterium]|nr:hypothetical protein [Methylococcaceae bacterium]
MNESLNQDGISSGFPLALSLGGGAFLGMAIGYFAKKALKITLFLTGLLLVGYVALVYMGIAPLVAVGDISPHLDETGNQVARFGSFLFAWLSSYDTAQVGSAGVGAVGGFFIGWKMG